MRTYGPAGRPETRYVLSSNNRSIAYQVFGEGERDILFLTTWLQNIDVVWDEPSAVRYFDRLSALGRVILPDKRGSGVSDPPYHALVVPLEDNVDDLFAVMDAVGAQRPVLIGDTEGGLIAIMLAATYPERFASLILINSFARLRRDDDYPIGAPDHIWDAMSDFYIQQHGTTGAVLEVTAPLVADDERFRSWWTRYQRLSMLPFAVRGTYGWLGEIDVRSALGSIQTPTLVVHRRDGVYHRLDYGRYLAEHIEGATLAVVEGSETLPHFAGDFGPTLDAVEVFLTGKHETASVDRMLSTVLFTDIVGSTERAAAMGDQRWLDLLSGHDTIVRRQLDRFRGREVRMMGDGCLATFDGPIRAVSCASQIAIEMKQIGLDIRAGIHTGEVEMRDGELGGLAIHIASRVMDHAESGGVMVSSTVKDLVVGSNIEFVSCGSHALKGVPGEWRLYEVVAA